MTSNIKKLSSIIILLIFFCGIAQKQVLPHFPDNQYFYKGGYTQFYTDAHQFLIENKYKTCCAFSTN